MEEFETILIVVRGELVDLACVQVLGHDAVDLGETLTDKTIGLDVKC